MLAVFPSALFISALLMSFFMLLHSSLRGCSIVISNTVTVPSNPPTASRLPSCCSHATLFKLLDKWVAPTLGLGVAFATGTSVSRVISHTSSEPEPSTRANTPGFVGLQRESYTTSSRLNSIMGMAIVVPDVVVDVAAGGRAFHNLTLQSSELLKTKSPRSTGPRTGWKSTDIVGAACPLYKILGSIPAFAPARSYRWQGYMDPSSVPTRKYVGSEWGKAIHVGLRSSVLEGGGATNSNNSWGCASISTVQPQTTPSVELLKMLFAFWVPTTEIEYTGWVWPEPVKGVFSTGCDLALVSQRSTWPL